MRHTEKECGATPTQDSVGWRVAACDALATPGLREGRIQRHQAGVPELRGEPQGHVPRTPAFFTSEGTSLRRFIFARQLCCVRGSSAMSSRNNRKDQARLCADRRALHPSAFLQKPREKQRLRWPQGGLEQAMYRKYKLSCRTAPRLSFLTTAQNHTYAFMLQKLAMHRNSTAGRNRNGGRESVARKVRRSGARVC